MPRNALKEDHAEDMVKVSHAKEERGDPDETRTRPGGRKKEDGQKTITDLLGDGGDDLGPQEERVCGTRAAKVDELLKQNHWYARVVVWTVLCLLIDGSLLENVDDLHHKRSQEKKQCENDARQC